MAVIYLLGVSKLIIGHKPVNAYNNLKINRNAIPLKQKYPIDIFPKYL